MSRMLPPTEENFEFQSIFRSEIAWAGVSEAYSFYQTQRHVHDYWEFIYIAEGSGHVSIHQEHFLALPGDLFIYPPGVEHIEEASASNHLSMYVLSIINTSDMKFMEFWPVGDLEYFRINGTWLNEKFVNIIKQIISEYKMRETAYWVRVQALSFEFQSYLVKFVEQRNDKQTSDLTHQHVIHARQYIQSHYHMNVSLSDIAESTHISTHYLSRLFKKYTGFTPMDYLLLMRIRKAIKLMNEEIYSISEISRMVGYVDLQHFSNVFKRKTGFSPRKYRQMNQIIPEGE